MASLQTFGSQVVSDLSQNKPKSLSLFWMLSQKSELLSCSFKFYNFWLIHLDESEDMDGRSTEFGLRSADYDQDAGDDNVR